MIYPPTYVHSQRIIMLLDSTRPIIYHEITNFGAQLSQEFT